GRGASGALYPQSALAGSNSPLRGALSGASFRATALMAWSCATWFREPCQVRKEAAVSGVPGAPQPTGPEWSALRARAALQREGVRGQYPNPGNSVQA